MRSEDVHIMFASCTITSMTSVRVWCKEEEPKVDTEAGTAEDAKPEKASAAADAVDDEEEADDEAGEDDDEDAEEGGDDDEDGDEEDDDEEEEEPVKKAPSSASKEPASKKQKVSSGKGKKLKGEDEDESDPEVVGGLSGDDVDKSNIIEGGRRSRKGRGGSSAAPKYQRKVQVDSDEDEW